MLRAGDAHKKVLDQLQKEPRLLSDGAMHKAGGAAELTQLDVR